MRKNIIALIAAAAISVTASGIVLSAETEGDFIPTYEQTASAYLDQDGSKIKVTLDITGGYCAEFVEDAAFLYDGTVDEDTWPIASGVTLDEEAFDEFMDMATASDSYREFARSFTYTDDDGTNHYFYSLGPDAYFMISVNADMNGDDISSRFSMELLDEE